MIQEEAKLRMDVYEHQIKTPDRMFEKGFELYTSVHRALTAKNQNPTQTQPRCDASYAPEKTLYLKAIQQMTDRIERVSQLILENSDESKLKLKEPVSDPDETCAQLALDPYVIHSLAEKHADPYRFPMWRVYRYLVGRHREWLTISISSDIKWMEHGDFTIQAMMYAPAVLRLHIQAWDGKTNRLLTVLHNLDLVLRYLIFPSKQNQSISIYLSGWIHPIILKSFDPICSISILDTSLYQPYGGGDAVSPPQHEYEYGCLRSSLHTLFMDIGCDLSTESVFEYHHQLAKHLTKSTPLRALILSNLHVGLDYPIHLITDFMKHLIMNFFKDDTKELWVVFKNVICETRHHETNPDIIQTSVKHLHTLPTEIELALGDKIGKHVVIYFTPDIHRQDTT